MKKILISIGSFLPGENAGGPVQSIKNLVSSTNDHFEYYIFTSNHDLNDAEIYSNVDSDKWNTVYGCKVFYSSDANKRENLYKLLKENKFSLIFLNDLFSKESREVLSFYKKIKLKTPIILMPRGQFDKGALSIKPLKKYIFLMAFKYQSISKQIYFFSTSKEESTQIKKLLNTNKIFEVSNIPNSQKIIQQYTKSPQKLNVVFLSRITPKKNLDYALETLSTCKENIIFDIYGIKEDEKYFEHCMSIASALPSNVQVTYKGELSNLDVIPLLSNYDLFYLTTKSENYGHVISEALQASVPVLISDTTPWTDLEEKGFGWEYPLNNPVRFSEKLDELALISKKEYSKIKNVVYSNYDVNEKIKEKKEAYIFNFDEVIREHINGEL